MTSGSLSAISVADPDTQIRRGASTCGSRQPRSLLATTAPVGALSAALALALTLSLGLSACATAPRPGEGPLLTALRAADPVGVCAAGTQLSARAVTGRATRVALWVTNAGALPALVLGATPQSAGNDDVSFVENRSGLPVYDGEKETLTIVQPRFAGDRFTLHHGLLLPGETVRVYSTVYPRDDGWSVCRYRLDYLSVPWSVARRSIYVARERLAGGRRVFRRLQPRPTRPDEEDADPPRLRQALITAQDDSVRRRSTHFRVVVGPVTHPTRARPRVEAERLAGVPDGTPLVYSDALGGWAFSEPDGAGVTVVRDSGERSSLPCISLRALREINRTRGGVPIVVDAPETWARLGHLVANLPEIRAVGVRSRLTVVPRSLLPELLETAQGAGLKLEAIARPHGLRVRNPDVGLLFARR